MEEVEAVRAQLQKERQKPFGIDALLFEIYDAIQEKDNSMINRKNIEKQNHPQKDSHPIGQLQLLHLTNDSTPTLMLCFICDWFGKVSEFNSHIRSRHSDDILKTNDGLLSIAIDVGVISKNSRNHQKQCFIEHEENLFIFHLKYYYPDIILPILLLAPPSGQSTIKVEQSPKFYMQIINYVKNREMIWSGEVERMNLPGRPLDVDIFANRNHGIFKIVLRDLDLIPYDLPVDDIPGHLKNCVLELNIFIEMADLLKNQH